MNIAIKLPNSLEEIIYTFPFLHKLYETQVENGVNIHLVTACEDIAILNLLPFKAFYYQLDRTDSESMLKVLRAFKNSKLDLQQYEYYFSLTSFRSDILLGKLLKAKNIIAFDDVGMDFFITEKIHKLVGRKKTEQYFKLLSILKDVDVSEDLVKKIGSKNFALSNEKEIENYIVIDSEILNCDDWLDFLKLFEAQRILILGKAPKNYQGFKSIENRNDIEIAKLLYLSKGFITSNYEKSLISSYTGTTCFYLKREDIKDTSFEFFIGKVYDINPTEEDIGIIFDMIYEKLSKDVKEVRVKLK